MEYAENNYSSRWQMKRWSHAARFVGALEMLELIPSDVVLDYGGGDGHLIGLAFASQPDASYSLFEPSWPLQDARVKLANLPKIGFHDRTNEFEASMFSKISCLEVLEHVTPTSDLPVVLRDIFRLLRPGGLLVVSMPIEFGPVSLLKNTFRVVTKTTFRGTSARTIFLSAIGLASRIDREEGHMGFDYRSIRGLLVESGFQLEKTRFTPLSVGGPLCNSQVIYRLRKPL